MTEPAAISGLARRLRTLTRLTAAGLSDAELLTRLIDHSDESAFEGLMWRHGPMVLGVCKRILSNAADADDAFQATFLVLFRKAASVQPRERLGAWLHGVAYQAARRLRADNARRVAKEHLAQRAEAVLPAPLPNELAEVLDRELAWLPEKYRVPVVLCDLEERPLRETAEQLGWTQGTLASRLARGRTMLARRLRARGLETLSPMAPALVSQTLAEQTLRSTSLTGSPTAAQTVAASLLRSLWVTQMKSVVAVLLLTFSVAGVLWSMGTDRPPTKPVVRSETPRKADPVRDEFTLADLPSILHQDYTADPYIHAAASLQRLGKDKAVEKLKTLAAEDRDFKTVVLCRMLFVPKKDGTFRRIRYGVASYLGETKAAHWPLDPIEIVDGVPFLLAISFLLDRPPESPTTYLAHCVENCDWNATRFVPRTKEQKLQALAKLLGRAPLAGARSEYARSTLKSQLRSAADRAEEAALQGRWRLVREEKRGQVVARPDTSGMDWKRPLLLEFLADGGVYRYGPELDQLEEPRRIDVYGIAKGDRGSPMQGIYELRGDRLRVCLGDEVIVEPPKHKRPTKFATTAGDTAVLREYVRETIAWGKAEGGLQIGLSVDRAASRLGEKVTFRIYGRNVSGDVLHLETQNLDFHYRFARPVVLDRDGKEVKLAMQLVPGDRPPAQFTKRRLDRETEVELGVTTWLVRPATWNQVAPAVIEAEAGSYMVHFANFETKSNARCSTGKVKLEVGKADEEHTDQDGVAWGPAADGVQFGLGLANSRESYRTGGTLEVVIHDSLVKSTP